MGGQHLQAATHNHPQLAGLVRGLQRDAVEALVQQGDHKGATKLFQKFNFEEADCPALRRLCERKALSWHVHSQHYDLLDGRLSRR